MMSACLGMMVAKFPGDMPHNDWGILNTFTSTMTCCCAGRRNHHREHHPRRSQSPRSLRGNRCPLPSSSSVKIYNCEGKKEVILTVISVLSIVFETPHLLSTVVVVNRPFRPSATDVLCSPGIGIITCFFVTWSTVLELIANIMGLTVGRGGWFSDPVSVFSLD